MAQHKATGRAGARAKGADGLTAQQRLFVAEYVKDHNATQAAIRAGYSPATAQQQGSRLLSHALVKAAIEAHEAEVLQQVQEETGITLKRTLQEIARIAFFDPRRMFDRDGNPLRLDQLDDDTAAVIAGLDVLEEWEGAGQDRVLVGHVKKWKLSDKKGALDMLMKHLGGYKVDNDQKQSTLGEQIAGFMAELHQAGGARLPIAAKRVARS